MKQLVLGFVALLLCIGSIVAFWPDDRSGPGPILYGRDVCAHCRMHLSQAGFAGELRDRNGVLTKYDDIGCLLQVMLKKREETPDVWVEDHDGNGFVPLLSASLVRVSDRATPMGHGIVAFATPAAAQAFLRAREGEHLALEDILSDPARFLVGSSDHAHSSEVKS